MGALRRALANKARAGAEAKAAKGKGAGQEAEAPPAEALRGGEDAARAVGLSAPKGAAAACSETSIGVVVDCFTESTGGCSAAVVAPRRWRCGCKIA